MSFNYYKPVGNCYDFQCFSCKYSLGKHRGCLDKEKLKEFVSLWIEGLYEPVK